MTWAAVVAWATGGILTALPGSAWTSTPITITSAVGDPNRVDDNQPALAIDGDLSTATFTTPGFTSNYPAYLEFGFASSATVNRLRLYKDNQGSGPRDLTIQYTTGSEALADRTWTTVTGLSNGFLGAELLTATAVNSDGTVDTDAHVSTDGSGWASLTFDTVTGATGLRIAFSAPDPTETCCNHYHVYEFQALYDVSDAPSVTVGTITQGKDYTANPAAYSLSAPFTVTDGASPPNTVECSLDNVTYEACTSPYSVAGLNPGAYTVRVRATDSASNVTTGTGNLTIVADSTAPTVTSLTATGAKNRITMQFAATDTDDTTAHLTYECALDGGPWVACTSSSTHTFNSVPGGPHTTHLQVRDPYSNTSSTADATVRAKGSPKR